MRARLSRRAGTLITAIALGLLGLSAGPVAATAATGATSATTTHLQAAPAFRRACGTATGPGQARCLVLVPATRRALAQSSLKPDQAPSGVGYGPASLQSAYLLPSSSAGTGETVAVVDSYDDPAAESDLAVYRSDWGLPPCTTANGCFQKVNQDGQASPLPAPSGSTGWATEESLDIDMVSAICPNCHILLVEANSADITDLGPAENTAVAMGAKFVSNSYAAVEYSGEISDDAAYYNHPGVAVTASAGDQGYQVNFPADSPHVVAVGGTSLSPASSSRGWTEAVWNGTGSGCSVYQPKPSWQQDSGCAGRTVGDVSAVADPTTGVAVYDSYDQGGWLQVGGTSASAPIIASTFALAGDPATGSYPASYLYAHAAGLNDVTTGGNGTCSPAYLCTAEPGYDGPTGLGTPDGITAFGQPSGDLITVVSPGDQVGTQDVPLSLPIQASASQAGQTLTFSATGLPAGLSIDPATGTISGTPTTVGTSSVKVTATDGHGASGFASFGFTVAGPVTITDPGPQAGYLGQPVLTAVQAADAVRGRALSYSATGLPAGLTISSRTGVITGQLTARGGVRSTVTVRDSAGRTSTLAITWYVAPAQAAARSGPVRLNGGKLCLTSAGRGLSVKLGGCSGAKSQAWSVRPDGSVQVHGDCLTTSGTAVQVASCRAAAQQWRIGSRGELVSSSSGKCLGVARSAAGATGRLQSCTASATQRWAAAAGPVVSAVTGECADSGAGTTGHLQVWYCGNTAAQAWQVSPDGTVRVGGRCLTVSGSAASRAACGRSAAQQWQLTTAGTLVNPATGKCLADPGDDAVAGTRLRVAACGAHPGEIWHVE